MTRRRTMPGYEEGISKDEIEDAILKGNFSELVKRRLEATE